MYNYFIIYSKIANIYISVFLKWNTTSDRDMLTHSSSLHMTFSNDYIVAKYDTSNLHLLISEMFSCFVGINMRFYKSVSMKKSYKDIVTNHKISIVKILLTSDLTCNYFGPKASCEWRMIISFSFPITISWTGSE